MDSTLLTAVIIVGITGGFIFLFSYLHKVKVKTRIAKRKLVYSGVICQHKLEVSEREEINDYIVVIDKANFLLLHIDFSDHQEEITLVDLWDIKKAELDLQERIIYEPKGGKFAPVEKQVIKLHLAIILKDPDQPRQLLSFYQFDKHNVQDLKITKQRVEYWRDIIQDCVKELPYPSSSASGLQFKKLPGVSLQNL